jgi:hypothetical protein
MHRTQHASSPHLSSRGLLPAVFIALVLALPARADVTIQEKTVSAGIGGFGGGITTVTRVIAGDKARDDQQFTPTGRLKSLAGKPRSNTTITRLDKELIWDLEPARKEYGEMTFAQMREAMAKGMEEAKAHSAKDKEDVQVDFKVDVQRTGKKDKVNGFDAEQWIITLTAVPKEKDKKGGEGVAYSMKLDGWYSTQVPGQAEVTAYYRRWGEKMGIDPQMRSMASGLMAGHGDAVREMAAKMKDLKGVAVRSTMTMDMGGGMTPEQQAQMDKARTENAKERAEDKSKREAKDDEEAKAGAAGSLARGNLGGALGGMFGHKLSKTAEKKAESSTAPGAEGGSGAAFSVTTDMLSVTTGGAGASFDVPADYKKVEHKK